MGRPVRTILEELGAVVGDADDEFAVPKEAFDIDAVLEHQAEQFTVKLFSEQAFSFLSPPEMAAIGVVFAPHLEKPAELRSAVRDAHKRLVQRLDAHQKKLKKSGHDCTVAGPEPEVEISLSLGGHRIALRVTAAGGIEAREVSGRAVPEARRVLFESIEKADLSELDAAAGALLAKMEKAGLLEGRGGLDADTVLAPVAADDDSAADAGADDDDGGDEDRAAEEVSDGEGAAAAADAAGDRAEARKPAGKPASATAASDDASEEPASKDLPDATPEPESGERRRVPRPRRRAKRSTEGSAEDSGLMADGASNADASIEEDNRPPSLLPDPGAAPPDVSAVPSADGPPLRDDDDDDMDWDPEESVTRQLASDDLRELVGAGTDGGVPTAQASAPSMSAGDDGSAPDDVEDGDSEEETSAGRGSDPAARAPADAPSEPREAATDPEDDDISYVESDEGDPSGTPEGMDLAGEDEDDDIDATALRPSPPLPDLTAQAPPPSAARGVPADGDDDSDGDDDAGEDLEGFDFDDDLEGDDDAGVTAQGAPVLSDSDVDSSDSASSDSASSDSASSDSASSDSASSDPGPSDAASSESGSSEAAAESAEADGDQPESGESPAAEASAAKKPGEGAADDEDDEDDDEDELLAALEDFSSEEEEASGASVEDRGGARSGGDEPSPGDDEEPTPPPADASREDQPLRDDSMRETGPIPKRQRTASGEAKVSTGEDDPWATGSGKAPADEPAEPYVDPDSGASRKAVKEPPSSERRPKPAASEPSRPDPEAASDDGDAFSEATPSPPPEMDVDSLTGEKAALSASAEDTFQALAGIVGDGLRTGKTGAFSLNAEQFEFLRDGGVDEEIEVLEAEKDKLERRLGEIQSRLVVLRAGQLQSEAASREDESRSDQSSRRRLADRMKRVRAEKSRIEPMEPESLASALEPVDSAESRDNADAPPVAGLTPGVGLADAPEGLPSAKDFDADGFDENDPQTAPLPAARRKDPSSGPDFEEGVSVAALAAELGHDATALVEAEIPLPEKVVDDEGDVFDSPSESVRSVESPPDHGGGFDEGDADDLPDGATRVAVSPLAGDDDSDDSLDVALEIDEGPTPVGLVVQDARALDRLQKYLSGHPLDLVPIPDIGDVEEHDALPDLRALVFVRPRRDAKTLESIAWIRGRRDRPVVLLLSSDAGFDEVDGIDLRLDLAKKAADVAQQVVDGLVELAVLEPT